MKFWLFGTSDQYECQNGVFAFVSDHDTLEDAQSEAERRLFAPTQSNDYIEWAQIIQVENNVYTKTFWWDEDNKEWG